MSVRVEGLLVFLGVPGFQGGVGRRIRVSGLKP